MSKKEMTYFFNDKLKEGKKEIESLYSLSMILGSI